MRLFYVKMQGGGTESIRRRLISDKDPYILSQITAG